ncbi:MAG: hypothetical protein AB7F86_05795 [Bdellovibrionales bacterium]
MRRIRTSGNVVRLIALLTLLVGTIASRAASPPEEKGAIKALMHTFVAELYKMRPYLATSESFAKPEGQKQIASSLETVVKKIKNPPAGLKESPGFQVSLGMLADHFQKTQEIFKSGELEYARVRLNATTGLCATCHMQAPNISKNSPFGGFQELDKKFNFENANFLFVIRRYDAAMTQFDQLIGQYPKGLSSVQLDELFRRKLAVITRVQRDFLGGRDSLKKDLGNEKIPTDIRRNVEVWIEWLTKQGSRSAKPEAMPTDGLLKFVTGQMPKEPNRKISAGDPQLGNLLYLSGLLYERLYQEPNSPRAQEILYNLALCERSLSPVDWYSVSEIYLKECIVRYPKKSFSKKCHEAYQQGMRERYFGKPIPESVQNSIEALKEYL